MRLQPKFAQQLALLEKVLSAALAPLAEGAGSLPFRILRMALVINRLPAKQSSKCRPLLFWRCWVVVNPGFSESGLSKIRFIQNLIFLRLRRHTNCRLLLGCFWPCR
jgi:hypothetical protein